MYGHTAKLLQTLIACINAARASLRILSSVSIDAGGARWAKGTNIALARNLCDRAAQCLSFFTPSHKQTCEHAPPAPTHYLHTYMHTPLIYFHQIVNNPLIACDNWSTELVPLSAHLCCTEAVHQQWLQHIITCGVVV